MDKLMQILFATTRTEHDELIWMMQHAEESAEKIEAQMARFKTAYGLIEQADLEAEYEVWVEESSK